MRALYACGVTRVDKFLRGRSCINQSSRVPTPAEEQGGVNAVRSMRELPRNRYIVTSSSYGMYDSMIGRPLSPTRPVLGERRESSPRICRPFIVHADLCAYQLSARSMQQGIGINMDARLVVAGARWGIHAHAPRRNERTDASMRRRSTPRTVTYVAPSDKNRKVARVGAFTRILLYC